MNSGGVSGFEFRVSSSDDCEPEILDERSLPVGLPPRSIRSLSLRVPKRGLLLLVLIGGLTLLRLRSDFSRSPLSREDSKLPPVLPSCVARCLKNSAMESTLSYVLPSYFLRSL